MIAGKIVPLRNLLLLLLAHPSLSLMYNAYKMIEKAIGTVIAHRTFESMWPSPDITRTVNAKVDIAANALMT